MALAFSRFGFTLLKEAVFQRIRQVFASINCHTGIDEKNSNGLFSIYPNPFNEDITIEIHDQPGTADLAELFNGRGEALLAKPVQGKMTLIHAKSFPSGVYLILLMHNSKQYYFKIVKM